MGTRFRLFFACAIVLLAVAVSPVHAQWVVDGIPVCTSPGTEDMVRTISDGEGGAIIVWRENRGSSFDIYAQRVDARGNVLWAANGVPVCNDPAQQADVEIVSDGAGGVIAAWTDQRSGSSYDIYAQRLSRDGTPLWTVNGVAVCTESHQQLYLEIVADGTLGAVICWQDLRGSTNEIYVQKINNYGDPQWASNGITVTDYLCDKSQPTMAEDGYGGAYLAWVDNRNGNWDIYGMRLLNNGYRAWSSGGLGICTYPDMQTTPRIARDSNGGLIVVWADRRNSSHYDIWAQRLASYGGALWTSGGRPVCTSSENQQAPKLVRTDEAGTIIIWEHSGPYTELYAQRINHLGETEWGSSGEIVCYGSGDKLNAAIMEDGEGGAFVSWTDWRYLVEYDVYIQRLSSSGDRLWNPYGEIVCDAVSNQSEPAMAPDGSGGVIVSFLDGRYNAGYDIFTQRMERNGYWGYPAPVITGVRDIPGDQGGWVRLSFDASRLDTYPEDKVGFYSIWRAIDETAAMAMFKSGAARFEEIIHSAGSATDDAVALFLDEDLSSAPVIRTEMLAGEPYYWERIATLDQEYMIEHYAINVETMFDSTDTSDECHYFQVVAHESDPTAYWISQVDSARSVDNIAPCAPLCLVGEQSFVPEGLEVTWSPNTEIDLDCYNIYRDAGPSFDPSPGNLLATTCDTLLLDGGWSWDAGFCYKVTAVDVHGNESEYALLCAEQVTGDDPMPLPDAAFLAQNFPNPFNPNTTIAFGLKSGGFVNLSIYNAAGQLVTVLIDESRPAGPYAAVWNGKAENGTTAASGVYFYRLITNEFKETKKMILLR